MIQFYQNVMRDMKNPNVENVWIALLKNIVQEIVKFVYGVSKYAPVIAMLLKNSALVLPQ